MNKINSLVKEIQFSFIICNTISWVTAISIEIAVYLRQVLLFKYTCIYGFMSAKMFSTGQSSGKKMLKVLSYKLITM